MNDIQTEQVEKKEEMSDVAVSKGAIEAVRNMNAMRQESEQEVNAENVAREPSNKKSSAIAAEKTDAADEKWRQAMKELENTIQEEMDKVKQSANDAVLQEKTRIQQEAEAEKQQMQSEIAKRDEAVSEAIAQTEQSLKKQHTAEKLELEKEHESELDKMKLFYTSQMKEAENDFREKSIAFRKEIDKYKEQIEILMLEKEDTFVTIPTEVNIAEHRLEKQVTEAAAE